MVLGSSSSWKWALTWGCGAGCHRLAGWLARLALSCAIPAHWAWGQPGVSGALCPEGRWHPPVPSLRMAGTETALNELLSSPLGEGGVPGVSGLGKGVGPCSVSTHPAAIFSRSALAHGQIRIRDPNQGGKDITEEIMSGARTSSTPTPPQVRAPPDSATGAAEVLGDLLNPLFASSGWKRFGAPRQRRNPPCSSYCPAR